MHETCDTDASNCVSTSRTPPSIVVIGGGTGAPNLVRALRVRLPNAELTAICPVTDSGRSTGVARRILRIPAPGDLRHSLSTLGEASAWADVMEQRLSAPGSEMDGMAVGNLVLGAFTQSLGDIGQATEHLAGMLRAQARVLPVSVEDLQLRATLSDGSVITGELDIRATGKASIQEIGILGGSAGIWPPAREAVERADGIILGPGSLWTSVGGVLVVGGVAEAIARSRARLAFVCNTTTQPGQTDRLGVLDHVEIVARLAGRSLDVVIANLGRLPDDRTQALEQRGLYPIFPGAGDVERLERAGTRLLTADLVGQETLSSSLWQKLDTAYHDMGRLAELLTSLFESGAA